jgi:hypothetical protein
MVVRDLCGFLVFQNIKGPDNIGVIACKFIGWVIAADNDVLGHLACLDKGSATHHYFFRAEL